MNVSKKWLGRYLDLQGFDDSKIEDMLTSLGLEVEGVDLHESVKGGLQGLVIGEVLTCVKHENADKLSVTTVNVGGEMPLQIVCGAPNVAAGQKVVVAVEGAKLFPTTGDPFVIKRSKIRGVESQGMICAEDEIGLGASHAGIMILDENAVVGTPAAQYFHVSNDTVFEVGLTPNRSDATCHLGVARDLHAYLTINETYDGALNDPGTQTFHIDNTAHTFDVSIEHPDCKRYTGLTLTNVKIGPSPQWIKDLLGAIGVKSINNVVDITNFILHEYGQPLHAFDADKLDNKKIRVTKLPAGTEFQALDNRTFKLSENDLVICDGNGNPLCIAGVYGGKDSGVTDSTVSIFLESAHFDAESVRKTSMRHNLRTDAAKVFEKGSDPNVTVAAIKKAAILMVEYAGAIVSSELVDVYPEKIQPREIILKYQKVRDYIGANISDDEIHNILHALNMGIKKIEQESLKVSVPTNKVDVLRDVDLIEEILRVYGFNNVGIPEQVTSNITYSTYPNPQKLRNKILDLLASNGFYEMMGLSLIESKLCKDALGLSDDDLVLINNTSNISLDAMRPDMMISGLKSVAHNLNRQMNNLKLCEFGKQYRKIGGEFEEKAIVSVLMSGMSGEESWRAKVKEIDFFDLKGIMLKALGSMGIQDFSVEEITNDVRFAYGLELTKSDKIIAKFGLVNTAVQQLMEVRQKVFYGELFFDNLLTLIDKSGVQMTPISKFPSVKRDLAFIVDDSVKFNEIEAASKKTAKDLLKEVSMFDIYKNEEQIGKGKKSVAIRFTFEDVDKTLTDSQIEQVMNKLMKIYETEFGAILRT